MPITRLVFVIVSTVALATVVPVKAEGLNESFAGTWVLESRKVGKGEAVEFSGDKQPREVLFCTGPHFIWGRLDPVKMKIVELRHAGQLTETENKSIFSEGVEYGGNRSKAMEGKSFECSLRIEGEKLIKTGNYTGDPKAEMTEQVFVRFHPAPISESTDSTTLGQQLIDLKKAKDAGALSEEEFEKQKAKLLQGSAK